MEEPCAQPREFVEFVECLLGFPWVTVSILRVVSLLCWHTYGLTRGRLEKWRILRNSMTERFARAFLRRGLRIPYGTKLGHAMYNITHIPCDYRGVVPPVLIMQPPAVFRALHSITFFCSTPTPFWVIVFGEGPYSPPNAQRFARFRLTNTDGPDREMESRAPGEKIAPGAYSVTVTWKIQPIKCGSTYMCFAVSRTRPHAGMHITCDKDFIRRNITHLVVEYEYINAAPPAPP